MTTMIHKKWTNTLLTETARQMPGYSSRLKKKDDLVAFIRQHQPNFPFEHPPPSSQPTTTPTHGALDTYLMKDLLVMARTFPTFKTSLHGKTKTAVLAFLRSVIPHGAQPPVPPVESHTRPSDVNDSIGTILENVRARKITRPTLLSFARKHGWTHGKKGTVDELVAFLQSIINQQGRDQQPPRVVVVETLDVQPAEWPVEDLNTLSDLSIKELKDILKGYRISEALPTKKKDILRLFQKKRCDPTHLTTCSTNEICDLRNELCRDDLKTRSTSLREYVFEGRRFWGSSEIIEEIKRAVVEKQRQTPAVIQSTVTRVTRQSEQPQPHSGQQESGREPVRLSRFMENERDMYIPVMKKAIESTFRLTPYGSFVREAVRTDRPFRPRIQIVSDENEEDV